MSNVSEQGQDAFCKEQIRLKIWERVGYDPAQDPCNEYGYIPSLSFGIAFTISFAILTLVLTGQTFYSKRWALLTLTVGGLTEVVGWIARLISHNNPLDDGPFTAQTSTLILGPSLFSAALYLSFGAIIVHLGPQYSLLKPKLYGFVFIGADVISCTLQGVGGGLCASADDNDSLKLGTSIMESGIVFQLAATIVFAFLALDFRRKAKKDGALPARGTPLWWLEVALAVGTGAIIIRGIYRTIELGQGWAGYTARHESFILFDAVPMVILLIALALAHPLWTLPLPGKHVPSLMRKLSMKMDRRSHIPLDTKSTVEFKPLVDKEGHFDAAEKVTTV
ncbi:RTA1-domain-containing protein [Atractiella rhizophila]|nr:RTA1-domain-containing protein [Atractiella rhizophila]